MQKTSFSLFNAEPIDAELKAQSLKGGAVTVSGQSVYYVIRMATLIILARLLEPTDFGMIAMVSGITGLIALFKDLGLSMATIQKDEINHEQITKLFWINVTVSILLVMVTVALAPLITWFFGEPRLTLITIALSLVFLFGGFTVQHYALLQRQMRFTALTVNGLVSLCVGSGVAIISSILGAGYWALVLMQVVSALALVLGLWWISDWRPGSPFGRADVKSMLNFGMNLTGFNILNYLILNFDNIIIGKVWGAGQLGLYSRAYGLIMSPINQLNVPIASVAIPALSRLQGNPDQYANYYYRALSVIAFIALPVIMTLAALSYEIIVLVLGNQWSDAAPIFNMLAFAALLQTIVDPVEWVYISLGQTRRMVPWGLFAAPIVMIAFVVGVQWGAYGVAVSYVICNFIVLTFPSLWWAFRYSPLTIVGWFKSIRSSLFCSLCMYTAVQLVRLYFTSGSHIINILVYCGVALTTLVIITALWPEAREQYHFMLGLVKNIIRTKTLIIEEDSYRTNKENRDGSQSQNIAQQYNESLKCREEATRNNLHYNLHLTTPLISVIIPTYNRAHYVTLAIDSVLRQTFTDYELILIDDGSTDETKENLKGYRDKIKYIYQGNSGVSAARNTGIIYSCGKWLAFLDSDDEWDEDYLSKQIDMAYNNPGLCMQMTNSRIIRIDGKTTTYFKLNKSLEKFKREDYFFNKKPFQFIVEYKPWQIGSTIILREAIMEAGLFNTSLNISEDFDLIARVAQLGPMGLIRDELVTIYRRNESIVCLTGQAHENPLVARATDEIIYEKLKMIRSLNYREINVLNNSLSKNRRAMGNILRKNGKIQEARYSYKRSLIYYPSIFALGRYILSFFPEKP